MKQKLELTWIGKDQRPRLEPRILLEDTAKSYHAAQRRGAGDIFDNQLIFGDNLLALKALEAQYTGKVKCVFIDPPYNTGSAFTHYDDGLEHSIWLGLMRDRLEIIRTLLADDGSLWITIDDNEAHYLKVMCDEIFGRVNFIANIVWNHRKSVQNDIVISLSHNHVLVFAKNKTALSLNRLQIAEEKYENPDNDPKGAWYATPFDAPNIRPNLTYAIQNPNTGEEYWPPKGRHWRTTQDEYLRLLAAKAIVFGKTGQSKPQQKRYLSDAQNKGSSVKTWWDDVGTATEATKELQKIEVDFDTPKPERLLQQILTIATNPNDLVLDSFAGSGTTGAVAHKMGRRWIMVELGEHCHTHIIPRLKQVIDGTDAGGVTASTGWQGGGGFRYTHLAPSLIVNDRWGNPIMNPSYNAAMLAQALCTLQGFTYAPSDAHWWQHGQSTETDFIYVTTQNLSVDRLQALADEVGTQRSLLVCCAAYHGIAAALAAARWPQLTLKKIPRVILDKCEWGKDDYSLNVANLPMAQPRPADGAAGMKSGAQSSVQSNVQNDAQNPLFSDDSSQVTQTPEGGAA
jgi:adenine-specific DNA-methyltransferase